MILKKQITILFCLVFIIGCSNDDPGILPDEDYSITGKEGVKIDILDENLPDILEPNEEYNLEIDIKNKGYFPQWGESFEGKIEFSGYDENIIKILPQNKAISTNLYGKERDSFPGEQYTEEFKLETYDFESETFSPEIYANICYKYKTIANPMVCIKDIKNINDRECKAGKQILKGGQGAPISVTSVNERINANSISFAIYVKNEDKGIAFLEDEMDSCPNSLNYDNANKLKIKVKIFELGEGICTPETITLENNEGYTTCKFNEPKIKNYYESPLNIELKYGYYDFVSKEINIVKI